MERWALRREIDPAEVGASLGEVIRHHLPELLDILRGPRRQMQDAVKIVADSSVFQELTRLEILTLSALRH